ncbi:related to myosin heavy chain [Cephalotrichum gorgonifer]|uniref:Related to myosin heavy chain n=1 Tax=Cephalotrichum gorgonifer TaxID=2041049 RepID=A0AAE8MVB4_9PEZI|nr:related to myosin heavy chain [Cephalotrichum gorgonifer]
MAQPGYSSLDTPRTNVGDATYLSRRPDFDMTQEPSFVSPPKDSNSNNLLAQLRNGRSGGVNLRTPRGQRAPFTDRRNLPASIGGAEFTPMLKSATRNSARRRGKENGVTATPRYDALESDLTPLPAGDASMFARSYVDATLPVVDSDSTASTPMAIPPRRNISGGKGPLSDGNQLSLREQENVIDKIEKENFGLKLKIHFLEDALRKAGPGFSEEALKENTELKVDKVTMQRELHRYKKHLTAAEKDLEEFRQQMLELQDRAKKKYADESQRAEMERLRGLLTEKEGEVELLQREVDNGQQDSARVEKLRDEIGDLEADIREKDRIIEGHEDELEDLRESLGSDLKSKDELIDKNEEEIRELKAKLAESQASYKASQRRVVELEEKAQTNEELDEARDTIEDLERNARVLEAQVEEMNEKLADVIAEKDRATGDLEELQEEMSNKSVVTKGLSRQIEEKIERLQNELDQAGHDYADLEKQFSETFKENEDLRTKMREAKRERDATEREIQSLKSRYEELKTDLEQQYSETFKDNEDLRTKMRETRREREASDRELQTLKGKYDDLSADFEARKDQHNILESRNDTLRSEATALQREVSQLKKSVGELEAGLAQERQHALDIERDLREQYRAEIDKLNDEISGLQAEIRERDNLYDNDSDKWESEKRDLESRRERAEEKAAGLQKTIDKLREAEGSLSSKETKLQEAIQSETERHRNDEAILARQIRDLQATLDERQAALTDLRDELSGVRDELRQSHLDFQAQTERVGALEDEVDVLQAELDSGGDAQGALVRVRGECDALRLEVETLRRAADHARSTTTASQETAQSTTSSLASARAQLTRLGREKQTLQDQLATANIEMHSLRSSLAEAEAERDELDGELRRSNRHGEETYRLDQEKVDLRTAKTKLDGEVRRLREENRVLTDQVRLAELSLEEEIEKAAEEEGRLNGEIVQLQARLRQASSSDSQELAAARRTIRDLERRLEEYEVQLAEAGNPVGNMEGNSELSVIRRDLTLARQKELEYLQKDSAHKEVVRGLKRTIADLERRVHDAETLRLAVASPGSSTNSPARRAEVLELRNQLSAARRELGETRAKLREAERGASRGAGEMQTRLEELEDEREALEQALEEARAEAEGAKGEHDRVVRKLRLKLEKAGSALSREATRGGADLRGELREAQLETEALEHDVRRQQETIEGLVAAEAALRRKLERARGERAAYRLSAEKLGRDVKELKAAAASAGATALASAAVVPHRGVKFANGAGAVEDGRRHEKEIRGLVMQMEWMQRRWEREAGLRADAAYAKRFLQLQLEVANACNKAQLRELESIRSDVLGSKKPLDLPSTHQHQQQKGQGRERAAAPTRWRRALAAARFIARMKVAAGAWGVQEKKRRRIVECVEGMKGRRRRSCLEV